VVNARSAIGQRWRLGVRRPAAGDNWNTPLAQRNQTFVVDTVNGIDNELELVRQNAGGGALSKEFGSGKLALRADGPHAVGHHLCFWLGQPSFRLNESAG
jgi:hypothetical protein